VPPVDRVIDDVTGSASTEGVLSGRLASNGLTDAATDVLRITGVGCLDVIAEDFEPPPG
jgi:hypothetical protein